MSPAGGPPLDKGENAFPMDITRLVVASVELPAGRLLGGARNFRSWAREILNLSCV
jgi:hypothetical protein